MNTRIPILAAAGTATFALALLATPAPAQERTLTDAVRRALDVHPATAAAREAGAAADAGVRVATAAWLPGVSLQGSAVRFQEPMVVAPFHGFDPTQPPDFDATLLQGTLAMSYTLFDGGRRSADVRRARAAADAAGETVRVTEAGLIERTASAYLRLLSARDVLAAQQRLEGALSEERARIARFVEEGSAPRLELLRAEAELERARAEGEGARSGLALATSTLARLLDRDPEELARIAWSEPPMPAPDGRAASEGSQAERAPDVARALAEAVVAEAEQSAARAAWFPTLSASAGYQLFAGGSQAATYEWLGGLQIAYPLFTGGARRGAVEGAAARARAALAHVEAVREGALLAADAARAAEVEARARAASLESAVASFEELVRVEALALDEGAGVQSDYLRAEAGLFETRVGLARARRSVLLARIRRASALGELDIDWLERLLEVGS